MQGPVNLMQNKTAFRILYTFCNRRLGIVDYVSIYKPLEIVVFWMPKWTKFSDKYCNRSPRGINLKHKDLGGITMEYSTSSEMARKWKISRRRVQVLCQQGRVEGAYKLGDVWAIPTDTIKPKDNRKPEITHDINSFTGGDDYENS